MSQNSKKVFIFNVGHLPSTCFVIAVNLLVLTNSLQYKHVVKKVGLCWLIDEKLKQPTWLNRFEYVITCLVYHKVWFFE
jgi:hypothetical protein